MISAYETRNPAAGAVSGGFALSGHLAPKPERFTIVAPDNSPKTTRTRPANGGGRYVRQMGAHGQYGHVKIRIYPGQPGSRFRFENQIFGGVIPKEFIPSVEQGLREAAAAGYPAGCPVTEVRVELVDGSYHDVDSSETAFRIAAAMAFQDAVIS